MHWLVPYEPSAPAPVTWWQVVSDLWGSFWFAAHTCNETLIEYMPYAVVTLQIVLWLLLLRVIIYILHTLEELCFLLFRFLYGVYSIGRGIACLLGLVSPYPKHNDYATLHKRL